MVMLNTETYAGRTIMFEKEGTNLVFARWKSLKYENVIVTARSTTKEWAFEEAKKIIDEEDMGPKKKNIVAKNTVPVGDRIEEIASAAVYDADRWMGDGADEEATEAFYSSSLSDKIDIISENIDSFFESEYESEKDMAFISKHRNAIIELVARKMS